MKQRQSNVFDLIRHSLTLSGHSVNRVCYVLYGSSCCSIMLSGYRVYRVCWNQIILKSI